MIEVRGKYFSLVDGSDIYEGRLKSSWTGGIAPLLYNTQGGCDSYAKL
jgi:hypothetical protein